MERQVIEHLINKYIQLSFDIWKKAESLIKEEISEDLTNEQHYILRYIHKNKRCTTTELAEAFYVKKSAITAMINRLVQKKLIERQQDENDRRVIYLVLTNQGRNLFLQAEAKICKIVESFLSKFEHSEIENFMKTYEKLAGILKGM